MANRTPAVVTESDMIRAEMNHTRPNSANKSPQKTRLFEAML